MKDKSGRNGSRKEGGRPADNPMTDFKEERDSRKGREDRERIERGRQKKGKIEEL